MFTFRNLGSNNPTNYIYVTGSKSGNSSNDISSIVFQNYDQDSAVKYDMAAISVKDHYGDATHDGSGDIIFKTNVNGSNLIENMMLTYHGNLLIGSNIHNINNSNNAKLHVAGDIFTPSNIQANSGTFSNLAVVEKITLGDDIYFINSNNLLGINTSNPRADIEFYNKNILSKNVHKLTKTVDSSNNIDIAINWDNISSQNQYYIILQTIQQISNATLHGIRTQMHTISTSNINIFAQQSASAFGNSEAYNSLFLLDTKLSSNSINIKSSTNWITQGIISHSLTIDILQIPDTSNIGNLWLT